MHERPGTATLLRFIRLGMPPAGASLESKTFMLATVQDQATLNALGENDRNLKVPFLFMEAEVLKLFCELGAPSLNFNFYILIKQNS